ncbi:hypothetical protein [uncultured Algibacter sp.]|uniref:hypothetical protein n=1 Tax=uncultured Algibacter sp. TaxID=298659 RepID=UPI0030EE848F
MQQLFSILVFYRPFIIWSLVINMLLSFIKIELITILVVKLLLIISLWHFLNETHAKRKLAFYKNLGISTLKLFSLVFVVDAIFSIPFLLILKEFV